jgi:C-terminal processing protease CtpA/Prc
VDGRLVLSASTLLDGSYRIGRVLGAGGFGITYAAEDINLGTTVAIKEYYPDEFGDRDARMSVRAKSERHKKTFEWGRVSFLEEARMLARFRHPSIVRVSRVFEAHATAYMVMDFEQGQSFQAWLKGLGRPPMQEELDRIAAPLLDALEMMHGENFLHRDIAPDNIVVRADGTPVLLDFGAARRAMGEMSRALTGIVKAGYSPHEQYSTDGRLQGPWSDLYALGGTLYLAVTGVPPDEATLRVSDDRMPPAAATVRGPYRQDFLAAIDACLKVRHADRPRSVAQLRPMLLGPGPAQSVRVAATRMVVPPRSGLPAPSTRPDARRWIAIAAAALAVIGGSYAGLQYSRWSTDEPPGRAVDVVKPADRPAAAGKAAESRTREDAEAARRQASAVAAKRKADDDALAAARDQRQQEERLATEKLAADERARQELESKRLADAGWLGVKIQNIDADTAASFGLPEAKGVLVTEITKAGPAAEAGLKIGDAILVVNGNDVSDSLDLARQIAGFAPNDIVELRILRGQAVQIFAVKLGRFPKELAKIESAKAADMDMGRIGLTVARGTGANKDSVVITAVTAESDAGQKGIKAGTVILEAGGMAVKGPEDVANGIREAIKQGRRAVLLRLKSADQVWFVALQLTKPGAK